MKNRSLWSRLSKVFLLAFVAAVTLGSHQNSDSLEQGFQHPPRQARMHCYWWWLNGNTTEATITRDLEAMKAKGYGGVLLVDANGSDQGGNRNVPPGPTFDSPEWRQLYRYAMREAARLGLEVSLTIQSGWNLGGPTVTPEQASKVLTSSQTIVTGPLHFHKQLAEPPATNNFYRDIAVLLYPLHAGSALPGRDGDHRHSIRLLRQKAAFQEVFPFSMPETAQLLDDYPAVPNEADTRVEEVQDVTGQTQGGSLNCEIPAGTWEILRVGYTDSGATVSTSSGKWQGLAIDYLDHNAFQSYWNTNVVPLLEDARPYIGTSLRYLVTDSWEVGGTNWTASFRDEFRKRRGYDLLPYLPIVSGRIVESRDVSNRFLNDFRKTIGDLIADEHYRMFAESAERYGLGIHPESGGPHGAPIDALHTLGMSTFPQTEFWAKSATHRSTDQERFFVKEASSAAHIYGKTLVAQEGMTSIGPQWEETIWNDLKPTFDQAICAGLNLIFWHTFTSSPAKYGLPGEEYFAGTHLNPNVTWWNVAGPFISYINRTQFLMQQGVPVSDVLYYYGSYVPDFVRLKASDPAKVLPGYDYDVTDEDVLLHRMEVRDGNIVLPGGVSYRVLALDNLPMISLPVLQRVRDLVAAGATVIGEPPIRSIGLQNGKIEDSSIAEISAAVWGDCGHNGISEHDFGKGKVYCGLTAREVLQRRHILPDFEVQSNAGQTSFDYVHRVAGEADIYFVRNISSEPAFASVTFRVNNKMPEVWHPDTGALENELVYQQRADGRTAIPLWFEPYGSVCIVFRRPTGEHVTQLSYNGNPLFPTNKEAAPPEIQLQRRNQQWTVETSAPGHYTFETSSGAKLNADVEISNKEIEIRGSWMLHFPSEWGAPAEATFDNLKSWTEESNSGIRYFSGTATYSKQIQISAELLTPANSLVLDLGEVREIAQVWLNGKDLGIAWKKPFRVRLDGAGRPGTNDLRIAVTNLWPNRLIGDQLLAPEKRYTHTNITKFKSDSPLLPSGLIGPVRLMSIATSPLAPQSASHTRTR